MTNETIEEYLKNAKSVTIQAQERTAGEIDVGVASKNGKIRLEFDPSDLDGSMKKLDNTIKLYHKAKAAVDGVKDQEQTGSEKMEIKAT